MDDLNEVTHSCKLHDIEEDCFVIEYARRKFGNLNVQTGCGYFEFTKSEYIPPEAQIILMSEVHNITNMNFWWHKTCHNYSTIDFRTASFIPVQVLANC